MNGMDRIAAPPTSTWLALVAETAGVAGAGVARVQLRARGVRGPARVIVQVIDRHQRVVGASDWTGDGADLALGTSADVGCDTQELEGLRIVAWIDEPKTAIAPWFAPVPAHGASRAYDPDVTTTLELSLPRHSLAPRPSTAPRRRAAPPHSIPPHPGPQGWSPTRRAA